MKLFEEFKLYEHLWETISGNTSALWINPDGIEIDLADPTIFDNELKAEKARCQKDFQKRLAAKDYEFIRKIKYYTEGPWQKTTEEVLDMWTESHMNTYERRLIYIRDMIHVKNDNLHAISTEDTNTIEKFYNNYYDISDEAELLKYIEAKMRHRGRLSKPALLARAKEERDELIRKLVKSGHKELVAVAKDKFNAYIEQFELDVPKE